MKMKNDVGMVISIYVGTSIQQYCTSPSIYKLKSVSLKRIHFTLGSEMFAQGGLFME